MSENIIRCPKCNNQLDVTENVQEEIDNNTFWEHPDYWNIGEETNFAIECQGCKELLSVDMTIAWKFVVTL
jgi:hypothetical protein